jgi:hypothetical protein
MKHLFVLTAIVLAVISTSSAQWTLDCNTVSSQGTVTQGLLQMRNGEGQQQEFYMVDSLRLRIFANPCSQTATYTYTMNTNERTAYYRYVYATPLDFTGDGLNEITLLTYYLVGNSARSSVKIFDITNGTLLLERRDPSLSFTAYPYTIADINNDGTIECVVMVSNGQTGQSYSEIYNAGASASGVHSGHAAVNGFALEQNYPNPFNPTTRIDYSIAAPGNVSVAVFNMLGQKVTTLVNGNQSQGAHSIEWNGHDEHGLPLSSGTYLYEVSINGEPSGTRRMILLR